MREWRAQRHSHLSVDPDFLERSVDTGVQRCSVCTPEFVRYKPKHSDAERRTVCVLWVFVCGGQDEMNKKCVRRKHRTFWYQKWKSRSNWQQKKKCEVKFGKDVCVRIKWQFFCVESVYYFSLTHKYTSDKLQDKPTKVSWSSDPTWASKTILGLFITYFSRLCASLEGWMTFLQNKRFFPLICHHLCRQLYRCVPVCLYSYNTGQSNTKPV